MKRTWRTCAEHPGCQEEIRQSEFDDKPNTYEVIHHRGAQEQEDSPVSPERFVRAYELGLWVEKLDTRAGELVRRVAQVDSAAARLERTATEHVALLDQRERQQDEREKELVARGALLDHLRRDYLMDQLEVKERLAVLEERSRPWYERMRGAR